MVKAHHGVFIIVGVVLVVALALLFYRGSVGKAVAPVFSEKVTCVFIGANTPQECRSEFSAGCTGNSENGYRCVADVSGPKGRKVVWKSACGATAITRIDKKNEEVVFKCKVADIGVSKPAEVAEYAPKPEAQIEVAKECPACPACVCPKCATVSKDLCIKQAMMLKEKLLLIEKLGKPAPSEMYREYERMLAECQSLQSQ